MYMREEIVDHITLEINFAQAKALAIKATEDYLAGRYPVPQKYRDRYGHYHGTTGNNRARNIKKYAEAISDENFIALLALWSAVFEKPDMGILARVFGERSSMLASMIADRWFTGELEFTRYLKYDSDVEFNVKDGHYRDASLDSAIFSDRALWIAINNRHNFNWIRIGDGFSFFDKTKGIRSLLHSLINHLHPLEKNTVERLAEQFKKALKSNSEDIDRNILLFHEAAKRYVEGATVGAFLPIPEMKKRKAADAKGLPVSSVAGLSENIEDILRSHVAPFLTELDAAKSLVLTRQAAYQTAIQERDKKQQVAPPAAAISERKAQQAIEVKDQKFPAPQAEDPEPFDEDRLRRRFFPRQLAKDQADERRQEEHRRNRRIAYLEEAEEEEEETEDEDNRQEAAPLAPTSGSVEQPALVAEDHKHSAPTAAPKSSNRLSMFSHSPSVPVDSSANISKSNPIAENKFAVLPPNAVPQQVRKTVEKYMSAFEAALKIGAVEECQAFLEQLRVVKDQFEINGKKYGIAEFLERHADAISKLEESAPRADL